MGSEGWAACSSGCVWSVSSRPVSPLLSIIELSSQPVALMYFASGSCSFPGSHQAKEALKTEREVQTKCPARIERDSGFRACGATPAAPL